MGTSPLVVAQTRRLLFAKQLLDETALSMTDGKGDAAVVDVASPVEGYWQEQDT